MAYDPRPMGTLLVPSGPGHHLFVIMNSPCPQGMQLLLGITSIKDGQKFDNACVFNGGEHEFIKKPSYVLYRSPEHRPSAHILKCVAGKVFVPKTALDEAHFKRICAGVLISNFTKPWMEKYCRDNGVC